VVLASEKLIALGHRSPNKNHV